jgi:hypothetical protein
VSGIFSLKLVDHYWFNKSREPGGDPGGVTSHGKLRLYVNGLEISGCEDDDTDYGINQAAVELLKSVYEDRTSQREDPVIPHGCSIWVSCPNCVIAYSVTHASSEVELGQFYVSGGGRDADPHRYLNQQVTLPLKDYAAEVADFARGGLALFPPFKHSDDPDENIAYGILLAQHKALLALLDREVIPHGILMPETMKTYREIRSWWSAVFPSSFS